MGNIYTGSINYHLNEPVYTHPEFNVPALTALLTSSITASDPETETDFYGPVTGVYFDEYAYDDIRVSRLDNAYLNYSRLQTYNYENMFNYAKQFSLKNTATSAVKVQKTNIVKSNTFSRQLKILFFSVGKLQTVKFSKKERDKLLWMLREKNSVTGKYEYWSSENIHSSAPSGKGMPSSKEILGSYFVGGTNLLDDYGKNYTASVVDYSASIPVLNPAIQLYTGSVSASFDEEGNEIVEDLLPKQVFLHKINIIDRRQIVEQWNKRGVSSGNKYTYWKEPQFSPDSTNYNTNPESNEILGSNYERQG